MAISEETAARIWASSVAEFGATVAVLNAGALTRAGLINRVEAGAMHSFLDILAGAAQSADQKSIVRKFRGLLPTDPELE